MELDGKGLGRLRRVAEPRMIWSSEAGDFTPWLADNLDVLADELGLAMSLTGTEVPVGDFRLDIAAETPDGRTVIIENQLERTDHGHLGQLLVYASGLEAAAVIWVATRFRDEFRRSLDWLNERTDTGVDFFGVEVGVVQIGESGPRAPVFDVVARPNGWQKAVKEAGSSRQPQGQRNEARQEFFAEVLGGVTRVRPGIRLPKAGNLNWQAFASGPFGNWALVFGADGRLRVEAYLDSGDQRVNKQLFDELASASESWRSRTGLALEWERLDERRASRIAVYHPAFGLDDPEARREAREWAVKATVAMYDALNETMRARARQIRDALESGHRRTGE